VTQINFLILVIGQFVIHLLFYFTLKICSNILIVIKYVGFTSVVLNPPEARVLPGFKWIIRGIICILLWHRAAHTFLILMPIESLLV
jgi:hypothetical protein